jgi:predicted dehydrogenase
MQTVEGVNVIADVSFVISHGGNMLEIYGTDASVFVTGGKMRLHTDDGVKEKSESSENLYKLQLEHFSRFVDGIEEAVSPGIAGLNNIQIISSAYESAKTGRIISINN